MATRVRCLKCFKIIECAPYDTSILLKHIKTDHPEIILPDDDTMDRQSVEKTSSAHRNSNTPVKRPSSTPIELPPVRLDDMNEETIQSPGRKPMYTRKYKVHSPQSPKSPQKRRMYRTSIEKWRPAKGPIYCPKCGANKRPIIRSRSEKLSNSTVGAVCILTCWPLCFLPCLFPSTPREYLHCAECNNFLGMYDKENNCVRPNRDFVEGGGCRQSANKTTGKPAEPCHRTSKQHKEKHETETEKENDMSTDAATIVIQLPKGSSSRNSV